MASGVLGPFDVMRTPSGISPSHERYSFGASIATSVSGGSRPSFRGNGVPEYPVVAMCRLHFEGNRPVCEPNHEAGCGGSSTRFVAKYQLRNNPSDGSTRDDDAKRGERHEAGSGHADEYEFRRRPVPRPSADR